MDAAKRVGGLFATDVIMACTKSSTFKHGHGNHFHCCALARVMYRQGLQLQRVRDGRDLQAVRPPASNMMYESEWCWDTAKEAWSVRREAWSGRVCALKKRTPLKCGVPAALFYDYDWYADTRVVWVERDERSSDEREQREESETSEPQRFAVRWRRSG